MELLHEGIMKERENSEGFKKKRMPLKYDKSIS